MRPFITTIALLAFTVHLLLGCCAHHAHGEEGLRGHQHGGHSYDHVHLPGWLTGQSDVFHHCHGHDHGDHEQQPEPTPHIPCVDPQCVYVSFDQAELPPAVDVAVLPVLASDGRLDGSWLGKQLTLDAREKISPHVRRHVALSRFLN